FFMQSRNRVERALNRGRFPLHLNMPFVKLGLSDAAVQAVRALGFSEPTPIQARSIPLILEDKDIIGSAQTGTGKTAAFGLPIISKLYGHQPHGPRALVLEPTRELAAQVDEALR